MKLYRLVGCLCVFVTAFAPSAWADDSAAETTVTWDSKHSTKTIALTVAYYVPADRTPLPDWRERVDYYCGRLVRFHNREFQGQSNLKVKVHPQPVVSDFSTTRLRQGDQNAIFNRTINEVDAKLNFQNEREDEFEILLVLSEINWGRLDDFYRLRPDVQKGLVFEGILKQGRHHPGSTLGGARAGYRPGRGVGQGLVSADGWRVPYRGSDCVVYHEGLGHTVGLPHPEPQDGSVMSLAQYRGWLNESWLKTEQKQKLGWSPSDTSEHQETLFTRFLASAQPAQPRPGQNVKLQLQWPDDVTVKSMRVRYQTNVWGPWVEVSVPNQSPAPKEVSLGSFDRATPVSFRIDVTTDKASEELWGYFQVRSDPDQNPIPGDLSPDLRETNMATNDQVDEPPTVEVNLLDFVDLKNCFTIGDWKREQQTLVSPKGYGTRLQIPYQLPQEYRLTVIAQPVDEPGSPILGGRLGENRFLTLVNHNAANRPMSAIENVDGKNVGNETTYYGALLKKGRPSQIVVTAKSDSVQVQVDGRLVINWSGDPDQLSLSDYWKTPDARALFVGSYDCSFRFQRMTLETLKGKGRDLR